MTSFQRTTSFLFLGSLFLLLLFWSYRWIWTYRYDHEVMKNWYEHSQWSIPLSPRIMGDGELYQYASEQLVNGANPFAINPEVPPLAKYLYGTAIRATGDPYVASALVYLGTVIAFGWIAILFFDKSDAQQPVDLGIIRFWAWLLFLTSPLFFSQIGQISLDLPQLLFLLLHIGFLWHISRSSSRIRQGALTILSGAMLGAFAATKFAVFAPLLGVLGCWWLWRQRQEKWIPLFALSAIAVYPLTYLPYFLQGHSVLEWLRSQKWIINFYFSAHVQFLPLMVFVTLFTGFFSGWWKNPTTWVSDWTLLWPLATTVTIWQIWKYRLWRLLSTRAATVREKIIGIGQELHAQHLYVMLLAGGLLLMNAVIPFWPRYLTLLLPFLILCSTKWLVRQSSFVRSAIFVVCCLQAVFALFPPPDNIVRVTSQALENQSYPELYRLLTREDQGAWSRPDFVRTFQTIDTSLKATQKTATITVPWTWPWQGEQTGTLEMKYTTPFGTLVHTTPVVFVRQDNDWRMKWSWNSQLPHFQPGNEISLVTDPYTTGILFTADGVEISKDGLAPFLSVTPSLVGHDPDEKLLRQLAELTGISREKVRIKLFVTGDANSAVPLGLITPGFNPAFLLEVQAHPAVTTTELPSRKYNDTLVSNNDTDHDYIKITRGIEAQHPELFGQPGGKIVVHSQDGDHVIFEAPTINGQNVQLTQDSLQLFGVAMSDLEKGIEEKK